MGRPASGGVAAAGLVTRMERLPRLGPVIAAGLALYCLPMLLFLVTDSPVLAFLAQYVPKGTAPMCGNSIGQDRRFLVRYMPKLEKFFHYRNVDVSTLKELAKRWKPEAYTSFKKAQKHTALADVHESIDELAHYRQHLLAVEVKAP